MPKTPKPKLPDTTATVTKDESLDTVVKDFNTAWDYCAGSWHDNWQRNHKLYNNIRVNRGYQGISDTFVPMVFGTVETLTSALFGAKPKFNFLAPHDKQDQSTDILNSLIDFYWDKDQWSVKVIDTGREMLQQGTSIDYFCWTNDHPSMIHVPLRDFFIDPNATSIETARYMGRRYLTTIEELKSYEIVDLDNPVMGIDPMTGEEIVESYQMKPKYKNLDKLKDPVEGAEGAPTDKKTDKQEKDDLYGSTLPAGADDDQVEVLEYWTKDKVISVMNRKVKIEDNENYYKAKARDNGDEYPQGLMPFAACRDYVDPSLFYARGEIDFIAAQQELLNDLSNQRIDAVTYVLNPMYTLAPEYADKLEEVENLPGAVYPFAKDALNRIDMGTVSPDAFNETMNIKNDIRETTASNEVMKGVGEQAGSKTTATEINAQIAGAGQRINLKITQLENEYFHRVARIVLAMIKLYVTEPMMVRVVGKDGAKWEQFDPSQFQADYEPRAQLDIAIQNKKQEQAARSKEMLAAFLNDPEVNQMELKKLVLSKGFELDPDEVETLMQPNPMMGGIDPMTGMPMQGMGGQPGMPGDPSMMGAPAAPGAPAQPGMPPAGPPIEEPATPTINSPEAAAPGQPATPAGPGLSPDIMAELAALGL